MTEDLPADTYPLWAKLPQTYDVERLRADIAGLQLPAYEYYQSTPLRAPAHLVDSSLPHPPPAADYADGSWTAWMDAPMLASCPYITEVLDVFRAEMTVNLVRVLRLAAGATVAEHNDPTLGLHIHKSMVRLTIPIVSPPDMTFTLAGRKVPFKEGECWYLRLTEPHSVENPGSEERVNLTIDVVPNETLRTWVGSCFVV